MSSHSLPNTTTPVGDSLTPDTKNLLQQPPPIWGKLLPTIREVCNFDLEKSTFLLGRSPNCDVSITDKMLSSQRLANISKVHFRIDLSDDNLIYITDLSKNGTFLNEKLIGAKKRCILQSDDVIAVSNKKLRVYMFKNIQNSNQSYLPDGLRQKYEVSTVLGEGASGEVRLVFDKYTCKPFACKRIIKSAGSRKRFNRPENIKKEVDILMRLKHPFIISLKEVEETPSAFFIIMDYMEGGELTQLVFSPKRLTECEVKFLFYQVAIAVKYLHDKNITHRDLKLENILLTNHSKDDNMVKISDFGLSKIISEQSMMKTLCGTPYFVAPEILDPSVSAYGRKVDVWSLGVILYYMFSQKLPFRAPTTVALSKVILAGKYSMKDPLWSELSTPPKDLIKKMLVLDPAKRVDIDQVVGHPWFVQDEPLQRKIQGMLYTNFETQLLGSNADESDDSSPRPKRIKLSRDLPSSAVD